MTENYSSNPRVFIGDSIAHQSDLDAFKYVYETLSKSNGWSYIFVNFNVGHRQVDLAVFTERKTLLIEAKRFSLAVSGGMNGYWEQLGPFRRHKMRNAYLQALEAKNALRDEINTVAEAKGYPDAIVAVMPDVPLGSTITEGDYKVRVGGSSLINLILQSDSACKLIETQCEELAHGLKLQEVKEPASAYNQSLLDAERTLEFYATEFLQFYGPIADDLLKDQYKYENHELSKGQVQDLVSSNSSSVLIRGPSGCGKSLLATSCALYCLQNDCLPIFLSAKEFNGSFQDLLDKEVSLLIGKKASYLLRVNRLLERKVILFLDGYNECSMPLQADLTRSLKAFSLHYRSGVVVSSQHELSRSELLSTKLIDVTMPSEELKVEIANSNGGIGQDDSCRGLLSAVRSGLEAKLIGQAGSRLPLGASRFSLFDCYSRIKLGQYDTDGINILTLLAIHLSEKASFSISIRDFDRLISRVTLGGKERDALLSSGLLHIRGNRVSFAHELFFAAFKAEAIIRKVGDTPSDILSAMELPWAHFARSFILGGIEDDNVLTEVISSCDAPDVLSACYRGECGFIAQSFVCVMADNLMLAMTEEIQGVEFKVRGTGFHGLTIIPNGVDPVLTQFSAYIKVIEARICEGRYIELIMDACACLDNSIESASFDLFKEAKKNKIPIRDAYFSETYVLGRTLRITTLFGALDIRIRDTSSFSRELMENNLAKAWARASTVGQYYFLIKLSIATRCSLISAPYVVSLIDNFHSLPYHLKLVVLDFARYRGDIGDDLMLKLIEGLRSCLSDSTPMMNTCIFEVLDILDPSGFDRGYTGSVQKEVNDILKKDGPEIDQAAYGAFMSQFDHPFSSAYCAVLNELGVDEKKMLYTKACRGAKSGTFFNGILIRELSQLSDSDTTDTSDAIAPWTLLPSINDVMPQDSIDAFIAAHEALGRLGSKLPGPRGEITNSPESCLLAVGELFYWLNHENCNSPETSEKTETARLTLLSHDDCASAGIIYLVLHEADFRSSRKQAFLEVYPNLLKTICREALTRRESQISYFKNGFANDKESIALFSIQVIGVLGDANDLRALRELSSDNKYGLTALTAIKEIESRVNFT
ncbi:NERD domain-containing protein [Idiomarina sp. ST20R2A10]|uniref:NERD domain-containing protein n=1 Tax=Idiomarina sp. ST20R2A10 TaxID=3418369 RepID=UPI003EC8527A